MKAIRINDAFDDIIVTILLCFYIDFKINIKFTKNDIKDIKQYNKYRELYEIINNAISGSSLERWGHRK